MKAMKATMIIFNQAHTERVEFLLDELGVKGFTFFEQVQGRGSETGVPHRGTHTWPEMNSAVIAVTDSEKVDAILHAVRQLDTQNEEVGIRAFVWNVERTD